MSTSDKQTQKWTLVPCALHFNIACGEIMIYEGVTSEVQGNNLIAALNASIAEALSSETTSLLQSKAVNDAIADAQQPLVDALKILLSSHGCLTEDMNAEIPEELSAQFDITLHEARIVEAALAKVPETQLK